MSIDMEGMQLHPHLHFKALTRSASVQDFVAYFDMIKLLAVSCYQGCHAGSYRGFQDKIVDDVHFAHTTLKVGNNEEFQKKKESVRWTVLQNGGIRNTKIKKKEIGYSLNAL